MERQKGKEKKRWKGQIMEKMIAGNKREKR